MKFPWRNREKQLKEELQSHLQMAARDHVDRGQSPEDAGRVAHSDFPLPAFERFRDGSSSFSAMFAWDEASASVSVDGQAQLSSADFVSGNYFDVLGVGVLLGRSMSPQDDQPGSKPVAVISYLC